MVGDVLALVNAEEAEIMKRKLLEKFGMGQFEVSNKLLY